MKNALLLHGTNGNSQKNWFPWLKAELEKAGWQVWVPDLPHSEEPSIKRYNEFLFANQDWKFNSESILVGHSSGAVEVLGLLQALPEGAQVDTCYLIGAFKGDLGWPEMRSLYDKPLDFTQIKSKAKKFVFIHSDDDPYCPLDHAEYLSQQVDGQLIVQKGQKHFNVSTFGEKYRQFPFLLNLIKEPHA